MFELGQVVATRGALAKFIGRMEVFHECLERHKRGDWGTVCDEDKQANDAALTDGTRLFSAYDIDGAKLWIITEADRSATTFLLPEEY